MSKSTMRKKIKSFFSKEKSPEKSYNTLLEEADGPILKVMLGGNHLATLFFDGEYCLIYKDAFLKSNLAPFNTEQLSSSQSPNIHYCYRSKDLWHSFASRIPSAERADYINLMAKYNLNPDANPLVILAKIGSVSISKPWTLEIHKGA